MRAMTKLTSNQLAVLSFVDGFISKNKYPPSYREISDGTGYISTNTVKQCLDRLTKDGAIEKPPGRMARCIRITASGKCIISSSRK